MYNECIPEFEMYFNNSYMKHTQFRSADLLLLVAVCHRSSNNSLRIVKQVQIDENSQKIHYQTSFNLSELI